MSSKNSKEMKKKRREERLLRKQNVKRNVVGSFYDILAFKGSSMMHSKDFIAHDCSLCSKKVTHIDDSHNAYPLGKKSTAKSANGKDDNDRCCTSCNKTKVIKARVEMIRNRQMPLGGSFSADEIIAKDLNTTAEKLQSGRQNFLKNLLKRVA